MAAELLPGIDRELIRRAYDAAPGREFATGKFTNPASSAALVANTFGPFLDRPSWTPPLVDSGDDWGWPPHSVQLEGLVRFPWRGGRHPCLDVLINTSVTMVGIESKRYEPFRKSVGRRRTAGSYFPAQNPDHHITG